MKVRAPVPEEWLMLLVQQQLELLRVRRLRPALEPEQVLLREW